MTVRGALTVVGQGVGAYFGGPWGAAIGSYIGSQIGLAIEGPQQVQGPRIADLKLTGSAYGTPIAYIEGHPRVAASIIWASDKREIATTTEVGGKGGPEAEQTTYTYEIDVLMLVSANEIAGVSRVWSNSKLVWTVLPASGEAALIASAVTDAWTEMLVYGGAAGQLPDPTYEAAVGAGNAPAYRGRGTVMIRGLQLGGSGQLPNLTFEIFRSGVPGGGDGGYVDDFLDSAPLDTANTYVVTQGTFVSGGFAVVNVPYGPYGLGMQIPSRNNDPETVSDRIQRTMRRTFASVRALRFKFIVDALNSDDAPGMYWQLAGVEQIGFVPRREAAFDALRRPLLTLAGSANYLGAAALAVATWYELQLDISSLSGQSQARIVRVSDAVVVASHTYAGTVATFGIDEVMFENGDTLFGSVTSGTTYADLRVVPSTATALDDELDDVVSRLCLRAGLIGSQIDVSELAGKFVQGFANGQVNTTRQVIEVLGGAYLFDSVESGGLVRFVLRGGAPAVTIAYDELGASTSDPVEPLPVMRRNDTEAPAQCVVRYINAADDYQDGSESSDRLTGGVGVAVVEVPVALQPAQAKALADVAIMDVAAASLSVGPVSLTRDYAALEPTDVVLLTDVDGTIYRARILKIADAGGVRSLEGVLDDASVLTSLAGTTVTGYTNSLSVATPAETLLELLDIPILRDADDAAGMYAAFAGATTPWPGAALFAGLDGLTYTQLLTCTDSTAMGLCTTALPDWTGGNVFDEVGTVTVTVGAGLLSSATRDEVLDAEANACLIGGEVLQFRTAALQSPGVYTLSGLLRGRRGTEWAQTGHAAGERFVLLRLQGLRRVVLATSDLDAERHYKGVTLGRALATAADEPFTCTGVGLKPFAPVNLRGSRSAGDLTLTWDRRTRLDTNFTNGVVPLGEASEAYDIDIYTTSGFTAVARTLSATSASVLYTAAQQTTDFGSAQAVVYARVYQRSAIVGRGYALQGQA
jgi:Putative phage tail protein